MTRFKAIAGAILALILSLGAIGWFTGWSEPAMATGFLLLILSLFFVAEKIGVMNLPSIVSTILGWGVVLCLGVIIWAGIGNAWKNHKKEMRAEEKARRDPSICKNDDGDWVKIPAGFYRPSGEDDCVEGEAPVRTYRPLQPVIVKTGKERIRHAYGNDGCYSENIESYEWSWYLVGTGKVKVTTPRGETFIDMPGKKFTGDYRPGTWRWCAMSPDALAVEIWQ